MRAPQSPFCFSKPFCLGFLAHKLQNLAEVLGKNWRCFEATQIFSPVQLPKNSGFSHSAQVKPESGACPLAKINKCLQRKRSYGRLVHFSSVFLQNLNPCNPLRCLYTNDFQKKKKKYVAFCYRGYLLSVGGLVCHKLKASLWEKVIDV